MFHVCMLKNINKEIQKWNIDYSWLKPAYWHFSCVICQLMHNVHSHRHPEQFYKQSVIFSPFSGKKGGMAQCNAHFLFPPRENMDHSCEGKNLKAGWYMDLQIYMSNILLPFLFLSDNPWQLWISWAGLSKSLMIGVDIAIDIFDMKLWYTSVSFDIFYGYSWADLCKSLMREVDIAIYLLIY